MPGLPVFLWCLFLGQASLRCQTYSLERLPSAVNTFVSPSLSVVWPAVQIWTAARDSVLISGDYLHPSSLPFLVAVQHFISFKRRAVAICFLAMFTFCVCPISICHFYCIFLSLHLSWGEALSSVFAFRKEHRMPPGAMNLCHWFLLNPRTWEIERSHTHQKL